MGRDVKRFSTTIERPPAEVFDYLSDVSRHGEWSPKPYRVEGVSGPVTKGDTFSSIGSIPGDKNHTNKVTVTEVTPPTRLVLDCEERGEHFINSFELEPDGSGTRVTKVVDSPSPPFPVSVIFPLIMALVIKPDVNKGLRNLKAALERS